MNRVDRKWLVLVAVATGSFMGAIDISIANVALPVIHRQLGGTVALAEWVVSIYLLVVCALLLSFGRLGDLHGHKRIYISGFVVFTISSVLCGLAWNLPALIFARALQALGAAAIFSNSPAILTGNFPASERGRAMGLQAIMIYLGQMLGPVMGGLLIDHFSWRAVFYINLPIGVVAVALSLIFIPMDESGEHEPFDLLGAAVFAIAFTLLLLGLNQGYERGWTSPSILLLLVGAVVLLAIFAWLEYRGKHPLLDLKLFNERLFSMTVSSAILNYMAVYTIIFLVPFYLIQGRGLTPSQTGLLLTIQPAIMTVAAPISGTLSDRIGPRRPTMLGMALLGAGLLVLARLQPSSSMHHVALGLCLTGLGNGIFMVPNNSALMGSAPRHRQGIAAGVLATSRYIGMILGVGVSGAVFTTMLARHTPTALFDGIRLGCLIAAVASFVGIIFCSTRALPRYDTDGAMVME